MESDSTVRPTGLISVNAAADYLGVKPWDVIELVERNAVDSVILVDSGSLERLKESA